MAFLMVVGSTKPLFRLLLDTIASLKRSLSFSSMFFDASRSTLKHKEPARHQLSPSSPLSSSLLLSTKSCPPIKTLKHQRRLDAEQRIVFITRINNIYEIKRTRSLHYSVVKNLNAAPRYTGMTICQYMAGRQIDGRFTRNNLRLR